eukprot:10203681-Lingulodinium_polyedra.AAC.1
MAAAARLRISGLARLARGRRVAGTPSVGPAGLEAPEDLEDQEDQGLQAELSTTEAGEAKVG